ncbi:MAG: hypothetical protein ACRD82_03890, partial [Blastocatellia bacterium]
MADFVLQSLDPLRAIMQFLLEPCPLVFEIRDLLPGDSEFGFEVLLVREQLLHLNMDRYNLSFLKAEQAPNEQRTTAQNPESPDQQTRPERGQN